MSHSACVPARQVYPVRALSPSLSTLAAGAGILFYFFYFAFSGLLAGFTHDDLMNLTFAWKPPWLEHVRDTVLFFRPGATFRPVGSLFYRALFELFGFHPLPYRIACYGLLTANLWLAWQMARRLTRSRRQAFLVTLLFAYHGGVWPLYLSSGFCYDLLCFFFHGWAMLYYLRIRGTGALPGLRQCASWAALYVLCIGSKEMAVSLPVVILAYEALRNLPKSWIWLAREGRVAMLGGAMTAIYLLGRMTGPAALAKLEAYQPDIRLSVFLDRCGRLLWEAFYFPRPHQLVVLALLLVGLPLLCRARNLRLALAWMVVGVLPVAFITPRGLAQSYIPAFGLALFVAVAADAVLRHLPPRGRPFLVYALMPAALAICHARNGSLDDPRLAGEGALIQTAFDQLEALSPSFPPNGNVLLLNDPFPDNDWASTFLVYLHSRRRDLVVGRLRHWQAWAKPGEIIRFDVVLSYSHGKMLQCGLRPFERVSAQDLDGVGCDAIAIAYP